MSGHKRTTVSISPEEFRKFHEADMHLRILEKDYQNVKERLQEFRLEDFQCSYNRLEDRQRTFCQEVSNLDEEIKSVEMRNAQVLLDQMANFNVHIQTMGNTLWEQTNSLLEEHSLQMQAILTENLVNQEAAFNRIQETVGQYRHEQEAHRLAANRSLQAAQVLLASIDQTYDHVRLAPGRIAGLFQELHRANQNFTNGMYEASLVDAQHICRRASTYRIYFEEQIFQQEMVTAAVLEKAHFLYEQTKRSRIVPAIDMEGNELGIDIDVNYWTQGKLKILNHRYEALIHNLEENRGRFDLVDLEQIQQVLLPDLEKSLGEMIYQARLQVISSQIRYNIASCVVEALHEQGFEPENGDYLEKDLRQPYLSILRNLDGSQVVIRVDPPEQFLGTQTLHVFSMDQEQRTEHELHQRAREVKRSLQSHGLTVGPLEIDYGEREDGRVTKDSLLPKNRRKPSLVKMRSDEYRSH